MKQFNTREELLQDAINYFWGHRERKCLSKEGFCQYIPSSTSEGCAIGRLIPLKVAKKLPEASVDRDDVYKALPKWMQKLGQDFLYAIQTMHDNSIFMNQNKSEVKELMSNYVDMTKIIFPN